MALVSPSHQCSPGRCHQKHDTAKGTSEKDKKGAIQNVCTLGEMMPHLGLPVCIQIAQGPYFHVFNHWCALFGQIIASFKG